MSVYGLFLSNPWTDLIFLLHIKRAYTGAVQQGVNFDLSWKLKEWEIFEITWNFLYILAILMSLYGLHLSNPSTDLIFLLHIERTYTGSVQLGVNFDISWKLKEWEIFEITWNFLYILAILMSFYGLHLSNPSTDLIFLLHMERTYTGSVQSGVNFYISWKLKEWESLKWRVISYMDLQYSWASSLYLGNPSTD